MPLIESILLLLIFSRIAGEISERSGQPAMIGELAAGVLLGPSILNVIQATTEIKALADIGVLLLVFHAGMEMDIKEVGRAVRGRGAWVGGVGFAVPLALGVLVGIVFGLSNTRTIFLGLCIAITALPVSVRILLDLAKLQTDIGQRIVSAAVANDVASLLILGIILDSKQGQQTWAQLFVSLGISTAKALFFIVCVFLASRLAAISTRRGPWSHRALRWLLKRLRGKEPLFALVFLFVIAFASFSEALGLHFVVGAFFGAVLLSHQMLGKDNFEEVQKIASSMTMGFLGPIFFATIGLEFNVHALADWPLVAATLAAAFAGKILGGYFGGQLAGLSKDESWVLGIGLNGRGIMELVIANIALSNAFIGQNLFGSLVLMAMVTTLATPALLKRAYDRLPNQGHQATNRSLPVVQ